MSRVGKAPVDIPSGVEVTLGDAEIRVKGPKGTLARPLHPAVEVVREENQLSVRPRDGVDGARAMYGTMRGSCGWRGIQRTGASGGNVPGGEIR